VESSSVKSPHGLRERSERPGGASKLEGRNITKWFLGSCQARE
jgi:hypothetical protein